MTKLKSFKVSGTNPDYYTFTFDVRASSCVIKEDDDKRTIILGEQSITFEPNYKLNTVEEVQVKDFEWVCNECNSPNLTSSVSEDEIQQELHSCVNCGCFEFHKRDLSLIK